MSNQETYSSAKKKLALAKGREAMQDVIKERFAKVGFALPSNDSQGK